MAAWVKGEEKAPEHRQRKREAKEADKAEVAPGVTGASLRCFRAALIRPTQGLPKRCRLCQERFEGTECEMLCLWVQIRDSCNPGGGCRMARGWAD